MVIQYVARVILVTESRTAASDIIDQAEHTKP
jgi:hypothetical protein